MAVVCALSVWLGICMYGRVCWSDIAWSLRRKTAPESALRPDSHIARAHAFQRRVLTLAPTANWATGKFSFLPSASSTGLVCREPARSTCGPLLCPDLIGVSKRIRLLRA